MQIDRTGDVVVATLPARVDTTNAHDVEVQLRHELDGGARKVVADFGGSEYVSSAGLRVFLATLKFLEKNDGRIVLCAMTPFVAEVFEISGFSGLFEIAETRDAALALLA
jgi:stage II sporulation protein AA (anti-sigma F factor antagonist)